MMGLFHGGIPLTRLAALGTLSRNAGEGGPSPQGWVGEDYLGPSETLSHG
jgi:hypothetical protein